MRVRNELLIPILKDAKALISDESHWIKEYYAGILDPDSGKVDTNIPHDSIEADCFCTAGAILRAIQNEATGASTLDRIKDQQAKAELFMHVEENNPSTPIYSSVAAYNDSETTTHADIMELFDKAIARLEEENA